MESSGLEVQEFDEKGPDVDSIKHEFNEARANLSFWMDKAEQARECRFNEWAGKDESGKKNGPEAFPSHDPGRCNISTLHGSRHQVSL